MLHIRPFNFDSMHNFRQVSRTVQMDNDAETKLLTDLYNFVTPYIITP